MHGYTKLFGSILASTIWGESKETKVLWITMLAMADKYGEVQSSIPGLATIARLSVDETEEALARLAAPDPYSRTKDAEGRRIKAIDGGWSLINHGKYREKMDAEERKIRNNEHQRQSRERRKLSENVRGSQSSSDDVSNVSTPDQMQTRIRPESDPDINTSLVLGAGTGVLKTGRNWGRSVFKSLLGEHLPDSDILEDWMKFATDPTRADSPLFVGVGGYSEANRLLVFAASERAIEVGQPPLKLFKFIVGKKKWGLITQAQEDRAAARIKKLRQV